MAGQRRKYTDRPGYTGLKASDLLKAQGRGAKIITKDPRWPDREVEYKPREVREQYPWHVIGEPTGWVRSTFCLPVTKDGGPWSVGELIRL